MAEADQSWKPRHNPWAIALTVTLATFMEVLDTSIANVALPHIAGGLAASQDEATWVLTSYLVANAVVLPASAWVSSRIGRKRFYMICVVLFTASSFLCGFATSLPMLIFFRVLQGIGGGGLAPSEQAILADTFEPKKRGIAFAVYGMAVVLAPAIGPTLGGLITDNYSWRWIFYINVPVGLLSLFLSYRLVEDPPWVDRERKESRGAAIDFTGLTLVALGFGALEVMLDKGQQDDWFGSSFITAMAIVAALSLFSLVVWEIYHPRPILDVRLFKSRNFAMSFFLMFTLGAVLFGTTVLIPQYLQTLMGYTAQLAGEVLSPGGLVVLLLLPIVGTLVGRVPAKYLIAFGFLATSLALFHMSGLYLGIDFRTAVMYRIYQTIGLAFLFVPINTISYVGVPREKNNQVSAFINLARNVGGSVGISWFTSSLAHYSQVHQHQLARYTGETNPLFVERLNQATQSMAESYLGTGDATRRAYGQIYGSMIKQAITLSYIDIIRTLAIVCAVLVPVILLLVQRNRPGGPMGAH